MNTQKFGLGWDNASEIGSSRLSSEAAQFLASPKRELVWEDIVFFDLVT